MPTTCPKCRYTSKESDCTPDYECPACGVIYQKYLNRQHNGPVVADENTFSQPKALYSESWKSETRTGTVLLIIVFTLMALFDMREIYFSLQVESWPRATGVIIYSNVSSGGRGAEKLDISYEYSVAGKNYQNDRASFGLLSLDGEYSDAQEAANRYPAGKVVDVYYQKSDPANSVLVKKPNLKDNLLRVLALLAVVDITIYYRFFKKSAA